MKKLLFIIAIIIITSTGFAQENGNRNTKNEVVRGPYETTRFGDNFFFEAGTGLAIYLGGQNGNKFSNRIRTVFDFGFGKWITPTIGVRFNYNYAPYMREYSVTHTSPYYGNWTPNKNNERLQRFNFSNLHADIMWNLSNAIGGYKETRVYSAIPYMGVGWSHINNQGPVTNNEISLNLGITNKFRISKTVDVNLEVKSAIMHGAFDESTLNNKIDAVMAVTVGATVRIGKVKGFKRVKPVSAPDYSLYINQISSLENLNNNLKINNENLTKENEELLNRKPKSDTITLEGSTSPLALFFNLNEITLNKRELTNLDFYVKNTIKTNKNKIFTIIGTADRETGTSETNKKISERRMQYVYTLLASKYRISRSRLVKKIEGDSNNRFSDPELNRTVIIE